MTIVLVTTDFTTNAIATNLAANTLTWVQAGVERISTASVGASNVAGASACELRVDGTVAGSSGGVRLLGSSTVGDHMLTVGLGGLVLADRGNGVDVGGANATVVNDGTITARFDGIHTNGPNTHIQNFGMIRSSNPGAGNNFGISVNGGGALIENFGTIVSMTPGGAGINLTNLTALLPGDRVENHGTIVGVGRSIIGSGASDVVINTGTLIGTVDLSSGADLYDGAGGAATIAWGVLGGVGDDTLRGGDGADSLQGDIGFDRLQGRGGNDLLAGGDFDDVVHGNAGDDTVLGGNGNDVLTGGGDDDDLDGGQGFDRMSGGLGHDVFVFNLVSDIGVFVGVRDRITDFVTGQDTIDLSAIVSLTFIKAAAFGNIAGQLRYATTLGELQIDFDGDAKADGIIDLGAGTVLLAGDLLL